MVKYIRNIELLVEHTGKRVYIEKVAGSVTVQELLNALAGKMNLPAGINGVLIRRLTRKSLAPNQSLQNVGLEDSETLLVDFERLAGGSLEFYANGRVKSIEVEPNETPYLADILTEIRELHKQIDTINKKVTKINAEIREIRDSTIVISGNDSSVAES